jgi:hypothetical protein
MTQKTKTCQEQATSRSPTLPKEYGSTPASRLTTLYRKMLKQRLHAEPVISYAKTNMIFKTLCKVHSELQVASLLLAYMTYKPTLYPFDKWLVENIPKRMYPIEMFRSNYNVLISYLIYDRKIEFDNVDTLQDVVYNYIERLT